jgi:prevent-host-death family protein
MSVVNMLEAKTHLSRLVDAVESGVEKEVVIARNGKPAARLVPVEDKPKKIRLGLARGKYPAMSLEEFNALDEEIAKLFNEGPLFPEAP